MNYKQCIMRKGNAVQTAWIPEIYAKQGKFLEIKDDNGWEVISVSEESMPYDEVNDLSRDYTRTRKASDV